MLATMPRKPVVKDQVNLRMGRELLTRMDRLGAPYGLSRTAMIIQAVAEWVERQEQMRGIQQPDQQNKPGHHRR